MSRGLGDTQRAVLTALADCEGWWASVAELADACCISATQARAAVYALARDGHVIVTKGGVGWKGAGQYGPRVYDRTAPWQPGQRAPKVPAGMPVHGLQVWLPATKDRFNGEVAALSAQLGAHLGPVSDLNGRDTETSG